jgi:hypothetical protein
LRGAIERATNRLIVGDELTESGTKIRVH